MEEKFKKIIEESLPAQVGTVLKTRLEQAERDAIEVKRLAEVSGEKDIKIKQLEEEIRKYMKFDERNSNLDTREKTLDEQEKELKIKTLEYKLESEQDKTKFAKEVALGLVRNSEYRRTLYDNVSSPGKDQYGNTVYSNVTQNQNEVKTTA